MRAIDMISTVGAHYVKKQFARKYSVLNMIFLPIMLVMVSLMRIDTFIRTPSISNYTIFLFSGLLGVYVASRSATLGYFLMPETNKSLKLWFTFPVRRIEFVLGLILGELMIQAAVVALFLAVTVSFFHVPHITGALPVLFFATLGAIPFLAFSLIIGLLFASREILNFAFMIVLPAAYFLSGAFYPLSAASPLFRIVSFVNPLTYAIDGIRFFMLGAGEIGLAVDLLVLAGFASASIAASWMIARCRRRIW